VTSGRAARIAIAAGLLVLVVGFAIWSYASGGLVHAFFASPAPGDGPTDALRRYVLAWGALAPVAYVAIVIVEVMVAPIPGLLLYAPGGAIFGGFLGGTLALVGNTIGAAAACWIAATFGEEWLARRVEGTTLAVYRDRLRQRGGWIIFVLRLNPFTSSDLVSYAAGLAGVPASRVAIATFFGMAPQCYLQAYLAATLFEVVPFPPGVTLLVGLAIAGLIAWLVLRVRKPSAT
jgi:uncharacterized membrane protein YdjX (TVP38/TMEM64 family)